MKKILTIVCFLSVVFKMHSQGIEDVIVEKYYTATIEDTTWGLPAGAVTYRVYIDLAPGYKLQTLFAVSGHPLRFQTTTTFFNHPYGSAIGAEVNNIFLNDNNLMLDSWITINSASNLLYGALKSEDTSGSVLIKDSLRKSDGMVKGKAPDLFKYELDLRAFHYNIPGDSVFTTENSILAVLGGVTGPTTENRVLVAQLTTDGDLSFELNVQLGVDETGDYQQYVAKNPVNKEIWFEKLKYPLEN